MLPDGPRDTGVVGSCPVKIGVLTGGGDVPGLNACIKAVVTRAAAEGHQVLGIRRGWAGLLDIDLANPLSVSSD